MPWWTACLPIEVEGRRCIYSRLLDCQSAVAFYSLRSAVYSSPLSSHSRTYSSRLTILIGRPSLAYEMPYRISSCLSEVRSSPTWCAHWLRRLRDTALLPSCPCPSHPMPSRPVLPNAATPSQAVPSHPVPQTPSQSRFPALGGTRRARVTAHLIRSKQKIHRPHDDPLLLVGPQSPRFLASQRREAAAQLACLGI